jgi:cysteinyl-tRNA synthetase
VQGRKDRTRLASLQLLRSEIEGILYVLGFSVPSYTEVLDEIKEKALRRAGLTKADLAAQLQERAAAREAKNYTRSDQIRAELAALGIALMDGGDGTQWRPSTNMEDISIAD